MTWLRCAPHQHLVTGGQALFDSQAHKSKGMIHDRPSSPRLLTPICLTTFCPGFRYLLIYHFNTHSSKLPAHLIEYAKQMTFMLKGQEIGITISEQFVLTHQCLGMMSMLANALT
jgi:hypothetical protein